MAITLDKIAQKAGVTKAAVSMALRNNPTISAATRRHIQELARKMGYRTNILARGLTTGKTQTIGMLLAGIYLETNAMKITAIQETAAQKGYRVLGSYHGGDVEREKADLQELLDRQVDGLIVLPAERTDGAHFKTLVDRQFPLVVIDQELPFATNAVTVDFIKVGELAVRHLIGIGRKKLAFIGGGMKSASQQIRLEGWRKGCRESGLNFEDFPFCADDFGDSPAVAETLAQRLVESGRPFDGLVASNDLFAVIAMKVLGRRGLKIQEDVAVIGNDDNTVSQFLPVPLTTIRHPIGTMGQIAVERLLRQIDDPSSPFERIVLEPELVVRESTQPAAKR